MRVAVHQPNVLPHLGFFAKLGAADLWIILDDVALNWEGYTRRVKIAAPDLAAAPTEWLTLPVWKGGDDGPVIIRQAVLRGRGAISELAGRLYDRYARCPGWRDVAPVLAAMERKHVEGGTMAEVNVTGIAVLAARLGVKVKQPPMVASALRRREDVAAKDEGLIDLCRTVGATTYIGGKGGAGYADAAAWKAADIAWRPVGWTEPEWPGRIEAGLSAVHAVALLGAAGAAKLLEEGVAK